VDQRSSVSRPRVHWIAIAPCGFGHRNSRIRTAFWMDLFGGSCSHLLRNARLGRGSAVSCPSGQVTRFAFIGGPRRPLGFGRRVFLPGTTSARPRAVLFGGRQTVEPGSGSSSNRTRSNNPLIGSSSELLGLARRVGRSKASLLSSCVNRGRTLRGATASDVAPSCPSGRTCPRPTCPSGCDGPLLASSSGDKGSGPDHSTRAQRSNAGVIFGWQWRRPGASNRVQRSNAGVIFGWQWRSPRVPNRVRRTRVHSPSGGRSRGERDSPGARARALALFGVRRSDASRSWFGRSGSARQKEPGGSPHGERRPLGPSRARCQWAPTDRGRDEGQRQRFRRTAARELER
jgi:hypothetical protein